MRADDVVGIGELVANSDGDGLLARIQMREAGNLTGGYFHVQPFLELANELHLPIGTEQPFFAQIRTVRHL